MSSTLKEIIRCDSKMQESNSEIENAVTLKALVLIGFKSGLAIAVLIIEEVLTDRADNMIDQPVCPICGKSLESKGWLPRTMMTVIGYITWKRKVQRCPKGCKTGQISPFDVELGIRPNQRTGDDVKQSACLPAVFSPFNIAAHCTGQFFIIKLIII